MAQEQEQQTASDDVVAKLRTQINDVTAQANKKIAEEQRRAEEAVTARFTAEEAAVTNGTAAATAAIEAAKARLAEAGEKGDWAALANAQAELNEAQISLTSFKNKQARLANAKRAAIEQSKQQQEAGPQPVVYTQATQQWLDKHGINGQPLADGSYDPGFRRAFAAHTAATEIRGLQADTPEYFAYLDEQLGYAAHQATVESPLSQAADTVEVDLSTSDGRITRPDPPVAQQQQRPAPVLSPSRTSVPGVSGGKVRLTAAEQEAARISDPEGWKKDPQAVLREYARNKAELVADGTYQRYG